MTADVVHETLRRSRPDSAGSVPSRLIVAWQHPETRLISPVGVLDVDTARYRFRYFRRALSAHGFRPFIGFGDLRCAYVSDELFPLFQQRVMNPRRPDYDRYVRSLDLSVDATPWEQLAKSGGRRAGDTIQLFPEPVVRVDGSSGCTFFAHGVRHVKDGCNPTVEQRIAGLKKGDRLQFVSDSDNEVNPRALLIFKVGDGILGWIPDLLLDYVHALRRSGPVELRVEHANGVEAPYHFRLIVRVEGSVPTGYQPFAGAGWEFLDDAT